MEEAAEKQQNQNTTFMCWGTRVDGVKGSAAAPEEKRSALMFVLALAVIKGWIDKKNLERLVHSCGFPLQHRRELYSLFDRVFVWLSSLTYGISYNIPGFIKDELYMVMLVLPPTHSQVWRVARQSFAISAKGEPGLVMATA